LAAETRGTLAAVEIAIALQSIFAVPKRPTGMDYFRSLRKYLGILAVVSFLLVEFQFANAASPPAVETQKIQALIQDVRDLKDATFIRNGSAYNSKSAAIFLRRKWQANQSGVKTARDFIDKVATFSGTSGKPYLIRFKDGKEIHSRDFLLARLKTLEG
jgi:hypothetical protein